MKVTTADVTSITSLARLAGSPWGRWAEMGCSWSVGRPGLLWLDSLELATLERHTHEHALETLVHCPLFRPDAVSSEFTYKAVTTAPRASVARLARG